MKKRTINMEQLSLTFAAVRPERPDAAYAVNKLSKKERAQLLTVDGYKPNEHGVFIKSKLPSYVLPDKRKDWQGCPRAEVHYTQLNNGMWIASHSYMLPDSGSFSPVSDCNVQYPTKEAAIVPCLDYIEKKTGHIKDYLKWVRDIRLLLKSEQ